MYEVIADLPVSIALPDTSVSCSGSPSRSRPALGAGGTFVAMNNRVSQSVPHLHTHVVPRTKGDGLRGFFWPRTTYDDADSATGYAARIAAALAGRRNSGKDPDPPGVTPGRGTRGDEPCSYGE